jgi:hypothetical protein
VKNNEIKKWNNIVQLSTAIININYEGNNLDLWPGGHNHGTVELDMPYLKQAVDRRSTGIGAHVSEN